MGDKVQYSKPEMKASREAEEAALAQEGLVYAPKTRETRGVYEQLLGIVQTMIGDQPQDVLKGALDEVLATLRSEGVFDDQRRLEIESILGPLTSEQFNRFVTMSKSLSDYDAEVQDPAAPDEDVVLNLDFEDEEQQKPPVSEPDNPEEELSDVERSPGRDEEHEAFEVQDLEVDPLQVDAFWLWRELSKYFPDPTQATELVNKVIEALRETDPRKCENALVLLFDIDKFDLVRLLMHNRFVVLHCTLLKNAQSAEERADIISYLQETPEGAALLNMLSQTASQSSQDPNKEIKAASERQIQPRKIINLSLLEFTNESLVGKKVVLPKGSTPSSHPGFEEVYIPPPDPRKDVRCMRVSEMPEWTLPAFSHERELNEVQTTVYSEATTTDDNMLVCAPTGSGKTNIALLTILRVLDSHRRPNGSFDLPAFKIVYVAPMKALVNEVCGSLRHRLQAFGVNVQELTGDVQLSKQQLKETQVIVTTPEKWDIVTRKATDRSVQDKVKLLIIDEIHLLHDSRGPVLEAIVARTLMHSETTAQPVRIVALSATLPNYADVAAFLRVDRGLFFFDKSYRPVPLEQRFVGLTEKKAVRRMLLMNEICYEKLRPQAGKSQVLVFVHSRKETARTAKALRDLAAARQDTQRFVKEGSATQEVLTSEAGRVENSDLKDLLPSGFAIHHAGLSREDRQLVEDLFSDRRIQVLVSTATLAWGVNLPARTVIIKGTQVYLPEQGCWGELSSQDLLQMIGRAGRRGQDTEGEGVVITSHTQLQYYLSLLNQQLPIESQFVSQLAEHLNAEVALGNVATFQDAKDWLGYTYLYVRIKRCPERYKVTADYPLEQMFTDLVHSAATQLDKLKLIKYDLARDILSPTALGRVASQYYLRSSSLATYDQHLKASMGAIDLLRVFSLSQEFKFLPVREEEKAEVARLMERVPVPVKGSAVEAASKVNVLLQAYISRLRLEGFTLMSDMVYVVQSAGRIMRALFELCLRRGWAQLTYSALNFSMMIEHRTWSVMSPLRQFNLLSEVEILKLEKKEGLFWEHYFDLSPQQLGDLVKSQKTGERLHRLVHTFPRLTVVPYIQPISRACLRVELSITKNFDWDSRVHGRTQTFWVFVEDVDSEVLLHYEQFVLKEKYAELDHSLVFTVPLFEPLPPQYFIRVLSDRWLHSETVKPISFKRLVMPAKYPAPTDLLDLQPVPLSELAWPVAESAYAFSAFNSVQSQVFSTAYLSDQSFLLACSAGSGRSVVGELALLRHLAQHTTKVLCLTPSTELFEERRRKLTSLLEALGEHVGLLIGDANADLKTVAQSRVVLCTARHWERLTRRWRQRKQLHEIGLVVVEEVQLLGTDLGVLEVALSRTRLMFTQIGRPIRIAVLGCSIANARDVAEWLGIGTRATFNFLPSARPVPLELIFQPFDQNYRPARLLAMTKPVYQAIDSYAPSSSVIVIVPDRKSGRLLALDLLRFAAGSGDPRRFARAVLPSQFQDRTARHLAEFGILLLVDSMAEADRQLAEASFEADSAQVLVVSASMAWDVHCQASLVVFFDTQQYDGREHRYADYSVPELLWWLGRAGRQGRDKSAVGMVLCHTSRLNFLEKFMQEPMPLESHIDSFLTEHFNSEVVSRTISSKQDAVDWITWSFMYRRLTQNPNYYNLQGTSGAHLNDFLSELVENTLSELVTAQCAEVGDLEVVPLNLGIVTSHYFLRCSSIQTFANSLNPNIGIKGLLEVLTAVEEFEILAVRPGEGKVLADIAKSLAEVPERGMYNSSNPKALLLLYAHFARLPLTPDLTLDLKKTLELSDSLVQALVDVLASSGWLRPALLCMTLSQMLVQAMWEKDSVLYQLPGFSPDIVAKCESAEVQDVVDLMNLDDQTRDDLLKFDQEQMQRLAQVCNAYPSLSLTFELPEKAVVGEPLEAVVRIERESELSQVYAPYWGKGREEGWWVVIGENSSNQLLAIKKVKVLAETEVKLTFIVPEARVWNVNVYLLCDSYLGSDQGEQARMEVYAALD
jgi:pre-mRNA-splicing helicase BRR2